MSFCPYKYFTYLIYMGIEFIIINPVDPMDYFYSLYPHKIPQNDYVDTWTWGKGEVLLSILNNELILEDVLVNTIMGGRGSPIIVTIPENATEMRSIKNEYVNEDNPVLKINWLNDLIIGECRSSKVDGSEYVYMQVEEGKVLNIKMKNEEEVEQFNKEWCQNFMASDEDKKVIYEEFEKIDIYKRFNNTYSDYFNSYKLEQKYEREKSKKYFLERWILSHSKNAKDKLLKKIMKYYSESDFFEDKKITVVLDYLRNNYDIGKRYIPEVFYKDTNCT